MSPSWHVTVLPSSPHEPTDGVTESKTTEGSSVSVSCAALASDGPLFVATIVYVSAPLTETGSGDPASVTARSAEGATVVGSEDESFEGSGSDVGEETCAVLVTLGTAATPTSTATSTEESAEAAIEPGFVHVTSCPEAEHDHPAPEPETNVSPAGKVSSTVIGPAASSGPALWTASVYVPWAPAVKSPVCDFVSERSACRAGGASTCVTAVASSFEASESGVDEETHASSVIEPGPPVVTTSWIEA